MKWSLILAVLVASGIGVLIGRYTARTENQASILSAPQRPPLSLATGTELLRGFTLLGRGTLTVRNGTSFDAAVMLVDVSTRRPARFVYIRQGDQFQINGIDSHVFQLRYTLGHDWDPLQRKFLESASYSQFVDNLAFNEIRRGYNIRWDTYEVTLHPVLFGNARTTSITEEQFLTDAASGL